MQKTNRLKRQLILLIRISFIFLFTTNCSMENVIREFKAPQSIKNLDENKQNFETPSNPYLKAHLKNGGVGVFSKWSVNQETKTLSGMCTLYNEYRDHISTNDITLPFDSISIIETNKLESSGTVGAMLIYTGITAAITVYCIINPKACFGSCPTFYVNQNNNKILRAEGFSSSVSPSMEAVDIDDLQCTNDGGKEFKIEMKNEALETHVVQYADILAVPIKKNETVFHDTKTNFWKTDCISTPIKATGPEGNILDKILAPDNSERFSLADSNYLGEKEIIEIEFEKNKGDSIGLVVGCRQTLMTTYLFYQTLAYMGDNTGYWFSKIENGNYKSFTEPMENVLGGIEIEQLNNNGIWEKTNEIREHGPLATDNHFVYLKISGYLTNKVRLKMTKGYWRLDFVGLTNNATQVEPIRIAPFKVIKDEKEDQQALNLLLDPHKPLVTLPGDNYIFTYELPKTESKYQLFLESRGYYLEWIRKEWMKEKNEELLVKMFFDPIGSLKRLAPEYKLIEPSLEENFWSSRYAKP